MRQTLVEIPAQDKEGKMKTQIELLKEAVKIAEENPTLEIIIAADSDELLQEYGWTINIVIILE